MTQCDNLWCDCYDTQRQRLHMTPREQAEHDEVIRTRQALCDHVFARGVVDLEAHCVHCGLPQSKVYAP